MLSTLRKRFRDEIILILNTLVRIHSPAILGDHQRLQDKLKENDRIGKYAGAIRLLIKAFGSEYPVRLIKFQFCS